MTSGAEVTIVTRNVGPSTSVPGSRRAASSRHKTHGATTNHLCRNGSVFECHCRQLYLIKRRDIQTILSFSGDQSRCVTSQTSVRPYGKSVNILTGNGISSNISTIKKSLLHTNWRQWKRNRIYSYCSFYTTGWRHTLFQPLGSTCSECLVSWSMDRKKANNNLGSKKFGIYYVGFFI
jgi:hypothetical protein